ncbi:MAG TPA: hypothetical protein VGE72_17115 [Azospirillum sp.]
MRTRILALLLLAAPMPGAPAAAADLHRLWDDRCAECHGDAGDFARRTLTVTGGRLLGRRPERDLRAFLLRHQGGLPAEEADRVYGMLLAQAGMPPLFQERCGICHVKASDLVRDRLILRDGVLVGRYTGRPVAAFLENHGRVGADEGPVFVGLLARIAREIAGGP